jgi:hypothetical protein
MRYLTTTLADPPRCPSMLVALTVTHAWRV